MSAELMIDAKYYCPACGQHYEKTVVVDSVSYTDDLKTHSFITRCVECNAAFKVQVELTIDIETELA